MELKYHLQCYGSSTVGERGQVVLPAEARKLFKIEPGDKLIVLVADNAGFERIILMKSEAVTKMFEHLMDMEKVLKEPKELEKQAEEEIKKFKAALNKRGVKELGKGSKKRKK